MGGSPRAAGSISFNKTGFLFCQADFGVAFITLAVRGSWMEGVIRNQIHTENWVELILVQIRAEG